jgi:hypothetical protein
MFSHCCQLDLQRWQKQDEQRVTRQTFRRISSRQQWGGLYGIPVAAVVMGEGDSCWGIYTVALFPIITANPAVSGLSADHKNGLHGDNATDALLYLFIFWFFFPELEAKISRDYSVG